jgi:hypothetical protein
MQKVAFIFIIALLLSTSLFSQESESKGKFSGYMFGDYYHVIKNHDPELKDKRGFWFRRIYLTYDNAMNKYFSTRLRLEMSNEGDFTEAASMVPLVKDAYLQYKLEKHAFILGISQTPAMSTTEKFWGYRYVEKTPLDLHRMASSRDFGLAAKGNIDHEGDLKYHLMLSNGSGTKNEIDKGKSALLSIPWSPTEQLTFEGYGEYADAEGIENAYTLRFFGGYQLESFRIGMEYTDQTLKQTDESDVKRRVFSAFVSADVMEQVALFLRVDRMFDPNFAGSKIAFIPFDPTTKSTFILAGVEWTPIKDVFFTPNIEYIAYGQNSDGETPGDDLFGRVTFYWIFR